MNDNAPTLGSIVTSDAEKKLLARKSKAFNIKVTVVYSPNKNWFTFSLICIFKNKISNFVLSYFAFY